MKGLGQYTDKELREELKTRSASKKAERDSIVRCSQCAFCASLKGNHKSLLCTREIKGVHQKHYTSLGYNKRACEHFEIRTTEMPIKTWWVEINK